MKDPIQEYINAYRKVFEEEAKHRTKVLELDEEVANLGVDVIEKGARKLLAKYGVDIEEIEKSNEQLSKQLAERILNVNKELSHIPDQVKENRQRRALIMQEAACLQIKDKDPCLERPLVIFTMVERSCADGCRIEVSDDARINRVYPVLNICGTDWNRMRIGEVYCEFIWTFNPPVTGVYRISVEIEFSGSIVQVREYHCYSSSSGTGYNYQLTMAHAQPTGPHPSSFSTNLESTFPRPSAALRYDGVTHHEHTLILEGGHRVYIHLGLRFTVSARSRFASVDLNFGDPREDNFIAIPRLCYSFTPGM